METATKVSKIIRSVFQKQNVEICLCWKYGCDLSVKSVSNQTEGTSVKKVDDSPMECTISLQEAQEQPTSCQEDNLNVANKVQGEASNSCQSPTEPAPKCTRKLPVTRSLDFLWGI